MLGPRLSLIGFLITMTVCVAAGCGKADVKDYVPADALAQASLASALDAWKSGRGPEEIGASKPAVVAQDAQWKAGKKLTAYEIVGPETSDDQNLRYRVRLSFADAAAPQEAVYVVFGKDPIWVFEEAVYRQASGM